MTLSVCIICKNEENNIGKCLNSIKNIANEIIVVDTGSTDKTIEIVNSYNTKLLKHPWNNDFSEARNISIKHATMDWILILDADEEIDEDNGLKLVETINNNPTYEGLFISLTNIIDNKESSRAVVFRVFKNNPLYKFEGKLHEQIITSIFRHHSQENILDTNIKILHYGYDSKNINENLKSKRNLDILLSYDEKSKDGYYYYALANELIRSNDHEECIKCYKKSISLIDFPHESPIYLPYLLFNLIKLLLFHEQIQEANYYFNNYIKHFSDFKDLYFLGCLSELGLGRFNNAKALMYKYNTTIPTHNLYPSNNLSEIYNILEINKAIEQGVLIENNPISVTKIPLTICILNTCYKDKIIKCLDSIKNLNCEKILLSTQPLDNTEFLNYNLKILETNFDNNYSNLKNKLLKSVPINDNWILFLESNEILGYEGLLKLQNLLLNPNQYKAYKFNLVISKGSKISSKIEIRLFKNNPNLEFKGKLYDDITSSCIEVFGPNYIANVDIQILSYTDNTKLDERLHVLNSYTDEEKDSLYYFYKGNDYFRNNNFTMASTFYKNSLNLIIENSTFESIYKTNHLPILALNLCISLLNLSKYNDAIYYVDLFFRYYKDFAVLYIIKAYCNMQLKLDFYNLLTKYNQYKNNNNYPFINLEYLFNI